MKRLTLTPTEIQLVQRHREESALYNRALADVRGIIAEMTLNYTGDQIPTHKLLDNLDKLRR